MRAHVLPDILSPNLDVVFCGTAASAKSARVRAYYAGPGNRFWQTLHDTGMTPRLVIPAEFEIAPRYGIGFTDVAKYCSGQDSELRRGDFDPEAFRTKIEQYCPRVVAFNGKKAASVVLGLRSPSFGPQPERISQSAVFVLPSTSAAAKSHWDVGYWYELAGFLRRTADD